ncbi:MAG: hypothetical protein IPL60_13490 [Ardenticatenia bacterium]|nr:hypothetical protein [Ardenticatenia bacterium]
MAGFRRTPSSTWPVPRATAGGWWTWDSADSFNAFVQGTLGAAMQNAGVTVQPRIDFWPLHNFAQQ